MITTVKQAHDAFIEKEEQLQLWERDVAGVRYWHPIRFDVYSLVLHALGLQGQRHGSWRSRPISDWLTPEPARWGPALKRSRWSDVSPVDLLVFSHARHVFHDGAWECPYTQPLLAHLPHSRVVIEQGFQGLHYYPNHTPGLKYLEPQMNLASARVYAKLGPNCGVNARARLELGSIVDALSTEFGIRLDVESIAPLVRKAVRRELGLGPVYRRLLDRAKPKMVVHVVHYSHRIFPMTRAARERGIPVVELQHGTMGEYAVAVR